MTDWIKGLQLFVCLSAILMLVTSVVLFASPIQLAGPNISKGLTGGAELQNRFVSSYIPHGPIIINSNADFASQGFPGNGIAEDPYVIEGYSITTTGDCISISGTDAYFAIRECLLTNGGLGSGVELDNVTHGEIRNNTFPENNCGVVILASSNNNTIVNNTFYNNFEYGLYIYMSSDNTVVNNTISGNYHGVCFFESSDSILLNNTISENSDYGVFLYYSSNSTVADNTISGNLEDGVYLRYSSNSTVMNNTISENQYGMVFSHSSDNTVVNNTISGNSESGMHLGGSNITVVNNIITGNSGGIYLGSNNTVMNNIISGNYGSGIYLDVSSNSTVMNNTISGNGKGVSICYSSNNTVTNNTISGNDHDGVWLISSSDNTFSSNIFVNNGLGIYGFNVEHWRQTITPDNLVNEKLLGYFWNLTSGTIDGTQYGQVILANCTGVTVNDGVFSDVSAGMQFGYSSYCSLMNTTISGNDVGVYIYSSWNNTVVDNTILENYDYGVTFAFYSDNNTVVNNTISGNDVGVRINRYSDNNLIYLNVLAGNEENAYDDGTNNHWNITGIGNYWSDYDGSGVYNISGDTGSIDYYPFIHPPEITPPAIDNPADIDYVEGASGNTIIWTPSDAHPSHYVVSRNNTAVAIINWDGSSITVNVDGLNVGVYDYTIVVYDTSGNWVCDIVIVTVLSETTTSTTTTNTTTVTTTSGDETGLAIVFIGVGGIGVVVVVLIFMRYRRGS